MKILNGDIVWVIGLFIAGKYYYTPGALTAGDIVSGNVRAIKDGTAGPNGGKSTTPNIAAGLTTDGGARYGVDVIFWAHS